MFSVASLLIAKREKEPTGLAVDKGVSEMSRTETLHYNMDESEHVLSERSHRLWFIYTKCLQQTTHKDRKVKLALGATSVLFCRLRQVSPNNLMSLFQHKA